MYRIQGISYSKVELKQQAFHKMHDTNIPEWEREIWYCIHEYLYGDSIITLTTSGSTGTPKKIQYQKKYLRASALNTIHFFEIKEGSSIHLCMNAVYIGAKMMIIRALEANMHLTYSEPKADALIHINDPIALCACVPLQLYTLIHKQAKGNESISKLLVGGASINSKYIELLQDHTTMYYQSFGMTETLSHIAVRRLNPFAEAYTMLPSYSFHIDNDSQCMVIHAPQLGIESLYTHDIIRKISQISFVWLGRKDWVINSGGVKVHPEKVEAYINEQFNTECMVTSVHDPVLGDKVILLLTEDCTAEFSQIVDYLTHKIQRYEIPKKCFIIKTIFKTASGKIDRNKTKEQLTQSI